MSPEELGRLLVEYDQTYLDCHQGCPYREQCERVRRIYDADANLCTAFVTLLKMLNEARQ